MPRGPPRKPKQSGHALWVGNLPVGTSVVDLKEHFSAAAKDVIESVFLIAKSNCAFVNYKTEEACVAAMQRFHDSRFNGVRLVCRLRRGAEMTAGIVGTTPSSSTPPTPPSASEANSESKPDVEAADSSPDEASPSDSPSLQARNEAEGKMKGQTTDDRYFIIKSLSLEDLELSTRNGTWATQSHNEAALNEAFEVSRRCC